MPPKEDGKDDEIILTAFRQGDTGALEILIKKYQRGLFGFIVRLIQNQTEAEDVFQETWTRVLRSLDRYKQGHFRAWLYRIAHNAAIDRLRHTSRETAFDDSNSCTQSGTGYLSPASILAAPGLTPDREAEGYDLGRAIAKALSQLSPEQREVFLLRTGSDLPFNEIARLQGVSINTALARMQYAIQKLRRLLHGEYHGAQPVDNPASHGRTL